VVSRGTVFLAGTSVALLGHWVACILELAVVVGSSAVLLVYMVLLVLPGVEAAIGSQVLVVVEVESLAPLIVVGIAVHFPLVCTAVLVSCTPEVVVEVYTVLPP